MLTGRDDLTADAVIDELARRNASVVRYDTSDFPQSSRVAATLGAKGWESQLTADRSVDLTAVTAVWWRRPPAYWGLCRCDGSIIRRRIRPPSAPAPR